MLVSTHYAGVEAAMQFQEGEPWKMVYGPVSVYLNSIPRYEDPYQKLWNDAKQKVIIKNIFNFSYNLILLLLKISTQK